MRVNFVPKNFIENATVAKIHTFFGKRLKEDDYKVLVLMKNIWEVAEYLKKNTHYAPIFAEIDPASVHRGYIETLLRKYHFDKGIEWCNFQGIDKQRFYRHHYILREINEILHSIMNLNAGIPSDYIGSLPSYLLKKASFDLLELAKIKDFSQLLGILRNTRYYALLYNVPYENGRVDFNICDHRLKNYYISEFLEVIGNDFGGSSRKNLFQIIKSQMDLVNIINIYRMKTYFKMPEEEILKNVISFRGRITKAVEQELITAKTSESFLKILDKTIYGIGLEEIRDDNSIYFERDLEQLKVKTARRAISSSNSSAVSYYCALYLLEIEVKNLVSILECIRYKKSEMYIQSLLINVS
jgi:V/A-type H+-transporting ATPase subunit C